MNILKAFLGPGCVFRWDSASVILTLGVDLAGWILQIRTKMPFHQYVGQKLLDPLKMTMSSFDMEKLKAD